MKITIKPIEGALDDVPQDHLDKWYEALQTSVKHIGAMSNEDDTAHCCVCVSARLEGATFDDYERMAMVKPLSNYCAPITAGFEEIYVARAFYGDDKTGVRQQLAWLNDGLKVCEDDNDFGPDRQLTHPQIAEIIKGNDVVIEVAE